MYHQFDVDVAKEVGVVGAVLFNNLGFWCFHSKANEKNFFDGRYWTYNSVKAYSELFPYLTEKMIRSSINKLVAAGLIVTGNYNKEKWDRTTWYALTEKGESIFLHGKLHLPIWANASDQEGEPIPDINTDSKPGTKQDNIGGHRTRGFTPPTLEEVTAYCQERHNNIDPQTFIDYYESNGWMVGKNRMKDYKATIRRWEQNAKNGYKGGYYKRQNYGPNGVKLSDEPYEEIIPGVF